MKESKTYSQEFKDKLVQKYKDTGSLSEVARKNSVAVKLGPSYFFIKNNLAQIPPKIYIDNNQPTMTINEELIALNLLEESDRVIN